MPSDVDGVEGRVPEVRLLSSGCADRPPNPGGSIRRAPVGVANDDRTIGASGRKAERRCTGRDVRLRRRADACTTRVAQAVPSPLLVHVTCPRYRARERLRGCSGRRPNGDAAVARYGDRLLERPCQAGATRGRTECCAVVGGHPDKHEHIPDRCRDRRGLRGCGRVPCCLVLCDEGRRSGHRLLPPLPRLRLYVCDRDTSDVAVVAQAQVAQLAGAGDSRVSSGRDLHPEASTLLRGQ